MVKKLLVVLGIILPWSLVLIFGILGLEVKNHFFQTNEVVIKISLLSIVLLSCVMDTAISFKKKSVTLLGVILSLGVFLITFFSMWFILILRNGIGF